MINPVLFIGLIYLTGSAAILYYVARGYVKHRNVTFLALDIYHAFTWPLYLDKLRRKK